MHIGILTGVYPALSETFVQQDIENLRRLGHQVTVAALRQGDRSQARGECADVVVYPAQGLPSLLQANLRHPVRSIRTITRGKLLMVAADKRTAWRDRMKLPWQAAAAVRLANELQARGVGHLHCHFAHAPSTVGMLAAQAAKIPFSFTGHANDLFQRRALLTTKLRRAAFVACISAWHRAFYRDIVNRPNDAYPIVRCGVDLDRFSPADTAIGSIGERLSIVTVARLVPKKGLESLLRAVALLPATINWQLQVIGDGPLRNHLTQLAKELSLSERVAFPGALSRAEVPTALQQANVFTLPCQLDEAGDRDGIPVSLMEAMASGLPVIAGDLPAIRELIEDEQTGLLVDGQDVDALAQALERLLNHPELRVTLGAAGRAHVADEFSATVNGQRLAAAIESCH